MRSPTLRPERRRRHQRKPPRWAEIAAYRVQVAPATAEADVHGRTPIQKRFAAYLEAMIEAGSDHLVEKMMAPIEGVLAKRHAGDATLDELEIAEQDLDGEEDALQMRYRVAESPELARRRIQVIDRYRARLLDLRQALLQRWGFAA